MPSGVRDRGLAAAAIVFCMLGAAPSAALDLFARHQVSVQFATADGKPLADAEVRVFAPGQPNQPALTGRTDGHGKFDFPADRDGLWTAEARTGSEVAHVIVRVGGANGEAQGLSPWWVLGGLLLLLVIAFGYRIARVRAARR